MSVQNWTIVAMREGKTTDNPHGGRLTAYYCDMVGEDQEAVDEVYWRRKEGNVPPVNEQVFGEVSVGEYGPRFKLMPQDGGEWQQRSMPSQPGPAQQTGQNGGPDWDERQRRIERQHSQEMALRLIESTRDAGDLNLSETELVTQYLNEVVRKLTDWFAKDLEKRS